MARPGVVLLLGVLLLALVVSPAGADPVGEREFVVNETPLFPGFTSPVFGADGSGNLVVVWDRAADFVFRRLDAAGTPLGPETPVGGGGHGLAVDTTGSFVIVGGGDDGDDGGVFARRFDASGAALGSFFQVNVATLGNQITPRAAPLPGGGFVIVWNSFDGPDPGIFGRRFDASGTPFGGEFQIDDPAAVFFNQGGPAVASDPGGSFVVVWTRNPGGNFVLAARRFDAAGLALGGEIEVDAGGPRLPFVAINPAGGFLVAWTDEFVDKDVGSEVLARRYDGSGVPLGPPSRINSPRTAVTTFHPVFAAFDPAGGFVLSFLDGLNYRVLGRRFDAAGAPLAPEFQVHGGQHAFWAGGVVVDASGTITFVWAGDRIRGRRYTAPAFVPLAAKKLLVRDASLPARRRVEFLVRDTTLQTAVSVGPNPLVDGAFVQLFNASGTGESACLPLPAAGWSTSGFPAARRTSIRTPPGRSAPAIARRSAGEGARC
jgi:hypothetical protein